jgi:hypothetical protein
MVVQNNCNFLPNVTTGSRWVDNVGWNLVKYSGKVWIGFIWLRIGPVVAVVDMVMNLRVP